jgi:hypothetical protein
MEKYLKIIFMTIIFNFISIVSLSNLYAEYCFEIPDEKTHEESKKANEIVFDIGVIIYESLQEIEKGHHRSANEKIALIREKANELRNIYNKIEKEVKHIKLNVSLLQEGDRDYIGRLIKKKDYREPRTEKEYVNIGLKEIEAFYKNISLKNIKYGEIRTHNIETIRELLYIYSKLTRIGFIISDVAYKNIGK